MLKFPQEPTSASVRFIQEILGRVRLSSTEVHTRVSIWHLGSVHDPTHRGAELDHPRATELPLGPEPTRADLLRTLDTQADDEDGDE